MRILKKYMEKRKIVLFEQNKICLDNYYFEPFQSVDEKYDNTRIFEIDNKSQKSKDSGNYNVDATNLYANFFYHKILGVKSQYKGICLVLIIVLLSLVEVLLNFGGTLWGI